MKETTMLRIATGTLFTLLLTSLAPPANAQGLTHYTDVDAGVWYEEAADALLGLGALDSAEARLRPNDIATRAELIKLLVRVYGLSLDNPETPSFDDVPKSAWYYPYVETAAIQGWVRGDRDCYKDSRPCTARPPDSVNRAEAAALLVRAYALPHTGSAPQFPDVHEREWYFDPIQAAADHCILQGDDATGRVRPATLMNRAEMIVMFHRASQHLDYSNDCGPAEETPFISDVRVESNTKVRVTFSEDLNEATAEDRDNYTVISVTDSAKAIVSDAHLVSDRTVELTLTNALRADRYRVSAINLRSKAGVTFSSDHVFTIDEDPTAEIMSLTVTADNRITLAFNADIDAVRAEEVFRYQLASQTGSVAIDRVVSLNDREVELRLKEDLRSQASYTLTVTGLRTEAGVIFSDASTFLHNDSGVSFTATLTGAQEVPAVTTTMTGTGTFTLLEDGLRYDITLKGTGSTITAAHFHLAQTGVSGDVVEPIVFIGNRATGTWTGLTAAERDALLRERIYVNVHTAANPNGEIRGQIKPQ
ncbi:MAG: CHRD domain-containing protein [Candidatus Peregrinibacteria bacterium]|nr:CHRD domain-containing protein [Candidatus Peregrinibacteria bacterium]